MVMVNFTGSSVFLSKFYQNKFNESYIKNSIFNHCDFEECDFVKLDFEQSLFVYNTIKRVDFEDCIFYQSKMIINTFSESLMSGCTSTRPDAAKIDLLDTNNYIDTKMFCDISRSTIIRIRTFADKIYVILGNSDKFDSLDTPYFQITNTKLEGIILKDEYPEGLSDKKYKVPS